MNNFCKAIINTFLYYKDVFHQYNEQRIERDKAEIKEILQRVQERKKHLSIKERATMFDNSDDLPEISQEQLGAISQIEAWKRQIVVNREYVKELKREKERVKKSTITVTGSYNYSEIAKLNKKIATTESQTAGIEMRMRKLAVKYNLQEELETFDSDMI